MAMPPFDTVVSGQALNSFGFVGIANAISGIGLLTFGFQWPCDDIWTPADPTITTTWVCNLGSGGEDTVETCTGD